MTYNVMKRVFLKIDVISEKGNLILTPFALLVTVEFHPERSSQYNLGRNLAISVGCWSKYVDGC